MNIQDREIIILAQQGKQEAYTVLVEKYQKGLFMYVQEFLSVIKDKDGSIEQAEEPQDICQEAFQKAFHNLDQYNPQYEFSTWLFNIARNIAIDYARKRKIAADVKLSQASIADSSPEDKLISAQEYQILIQHIDNLDSKYRNIARMRFIKEYAYDEIALELNLQLNTVKTRIKRAKEQLIELIKH